jgi:hypothetical protein
VLRRRTVARICRIRRERREVNLVDEVRAEDEEERAKSVVRGAIGAEATAARDEETTIESNRIESIRFFRWTRSIVPRPATEEVGATKPRRRCGSKTRRDATTTRRGGGERLNRYVGGRPEWRLNLVLHTNPG